MATLGCSQHVCYIQGKCNGARLCELFDVSLISYDRRLDDISEAVVEVTISGDSDNPCCACLGNAEPWCHVLTIVREGDGVVWTGPIQSIIYGYDKVRIEAKDKLAWLQVRVNETPIDYNPNPPSGSGLLHPVPLTTIAKRICEVAMIDDDDSPCFLDCILDLGDGQPLDAPRNVEFPGFGGPTAYDDLTSLGSGGIDFTVVNQCLILGPETLPARAIGTLLDEHIMGDISVIKDGNLLGNRYFVRYTGDDDCAGRCIPQHLPDPCVPEYICCPCPAVVETTEEGRSCYGLVERLIADTLGIPNVTSATNLGNQLLNASKVAPRVIQFPSGTQLSPDTPWGINDMIPGQRIDVALSKLCLPVFQSFKLQHVTVEDGAEGEKISIELKALPIVSGLE